jgi:hypothetical protein
VRGYVKALRVGLESGAVNLCGAGSHVDQIHPRLWIHLEGEFQWRHVNKYKLIAFSCTGVPFCS